jgi:chaperone modulatory protein CbpM
MESNELIPIHTFHLHYHVEEAFITSLYDLQLVEITTIDDVRYVAVTHLPQVEKLIRLHSDFNLNADALAVAAHLLEKVENLQSELLTLRSRLRIYED